MLQRIRRPAGALTALLLIGALIFSAFAAGTGIDLQRTGSISITLKQADGTPVPGVRFALYRVADVVRQDGGLAYRYTPAFAGSGMELGELKGDNLAGHLAAYAAEQKLEPVTQATGQDGFVGWGELSLGLYLLVQEGEIPGYYSIAPFLVSVPHSGEGAGWVYDVLADPKFELQPTHPGTVQYAVRKLWSGKDDHRPDHITVSLLRDGQVWQTVTLSDANGWKYTWTDLDSSHRWSVVETEVPDGYTVSYTAAGQTITITNHIPTEEPPPSSEPPLIQTGQLNWPVPVMAAGGIFLLAMGWMLLSGKGRKDEP